VLVPVFMVAIAAVFLFLAVPLGGPAKVVLGRLAAGVAILVASYLIGNTFDSEDGSGRTLLGEFLIVLPAAAFIFSIQRATLVLALLSPMVALGFWSGTAHHTIALHGKGDTVGIAYFAGIIFACLATAGLSLGLWVRRRLGHDR
jgi:hypothetical protein